MRDKHRFDEVRQEIIQLLCAQLEALADLSGLSDVQLAACYERQERVRQLRDQLCVGNEWEAEDAVLIGQASTSLPDNPEAAAVGI